MFYKSVVASVLMAGLLLVGCGSGDNTSTKKKPAPSPAPATNASTDNDPAKDQPAKELDWQAEYASTSGISGSVKSVGSDTLNNLMALWSEGFKKHYPNVDISVDGKGSSTAPPALIDGTSDIGPMSRKMKSEEIDEFEKKFGYKPSYVAVAIDALAVFVHKDNPIESLSLEQVDAIFSSTRRGGYAEDITTWGQVGLTGEWENLGLTLLGRNSASGTYGYFKSKACFKGDFKSTVNEQPGSAAVIQSTGTDRSAISYSGMGFKTAAVKFVNLSRKGGAAFAPTTQNCYDRKYPLSRYLYVYFNRAPDTDLKPVVREFFTYVCSKSGQDIVAGNGFIRLNKEGFDEYVEEYR
ncbi:MAG: PstS family phosphate ABC transporter substrate-binding protein [Planctomycetota bacterium]|jgi:phosphate transport system substrate-binding protein